MSSIRDLRRAFDLPWRILDRLSDKSLMEKVGRSLAENIKNRTRSGYGTDRNNGTRKRLATLRPLTILLRTKAANEGRLHSATRPRLSNLTFTGKMLDDIGYEAERGGVTILFKSEDENRKAGYAHDGAPNREKRKFFFATRTEVREAVRILQEARDNVIRNL